MKKIVLLLLALIMIMSVVSCNNSTNEPQDTSDSDTTDQTTADSPEDNKAFVFDGKYYADLYGFDESLLIPNPKEEDKELFVSWANLINEQRFEDTINYWNDSDRKTYTWIFDEAPHMGEDGIFNWVSISDISLAAVPLPISMYHQELDRKGYYIFDENYSDFSFYIVKLTAVVKKDTNFKINGENLFLLGCGTNKDNERVFMQMSVPHNGFLRYMSESGVISDKDVENYINERINRLGDFTA